MGKIKNFLDRKIWPWKISLALISIPLAINITVNIILDPISSNDIKKIVEALPKKSIAIEPFVDAQHLKTKYIESLDSFTVRQYDSSIFKLESILKDTSFNSNNKANSAYVYYWLGENYFAKGNYDKALEYFKNKLSEDTIRHNFYLSAQKKLATIYMTGKCYEKKYWRSKSEDDRTKAIQYYEQLEQESKYNYCQPIFEYGRKTLKKLKRAR